VDRVAELAGHWDAARDASAALRCLVAAAEQAEQSFAFEAAFDDYELALGWWESVDDAPAVAGIDHAALLLDAADAAGLAGHSGRAADLARAGVDAGAARHARRGGGGAGRVYPPRAEADGGAGRRCPGPRTRRRCSRACSTTTPRSRPTFRISRVPSRSSTRSMRSSSASGCGATS